MVGTRDHPLMISAPLPPDEVRRLAALRDLHLLDTPREQRFDRITRLASRLMQVPIALITLVDKDRQWFKSSLGIQVSETPRTASFCAHAILDNRLLVVPDALKDERFFDNPLVAGSPDIRFYAGAPLSARDGSRVGTLCVIDHTPRTLTAEQAEVLRDLADLAEAEINSVTLQDALTRLAQSEEIFRLLAQLAPVGIFLTDANGHCGYVNERWSQLAGTRGEAVLGLRWTEMVHPQDRTQALADWQQAAAEGTEYHGTFRFFHPDGSIVWVSARAMPLNDLSGTVIRWAGTCSDVTALTEARFETERARDAAELASQAKARFLANMSHEIRTPLSGVLGIIRILLDKNLGPEERALADLVHRNAHALLAIVNDVLDFSKVEAGHIELEQRTFAIRVLLEDIFQLYATRASAKGLVLEARATEDVPQFLIGDDTRLRQVLNNLVSNAIKFTESGCVSIIVSVVQRRNTDVSLRFAVKDDGIGISAEARGRIFDEFAQADSSMTRKYGGTGLGLAICQRIIAVMGGLIEVESEPGRGSTFFFTAPFFVAAELPGLPQPEPPHGKMCNVPTGLRVLVADDSETNRFVAIHCLKQLGCLVDSATNGREAVTAARQKHYDVILMDCQMPEMDGYTATQIIRSSGNSACTTRIIALTAHALAGERERCLAAGMNDYLCKPLELGQLCECLTAVTPAQTEDHATAESDAATCQAVETLLEEFDRDTKIFEYMLTVFFRESGEAVNALRSAVTANDHRGVASAAHKLRGIVANFQADRLMQLTTVMEEEARRGSLTDPLTDVIKIESELDHLCTVLRRECLRITKTATLAE